MRRAVAVAVVGAALLWAFPATASAHAGFVSSEPANGEVLAASPDAVSLTFTEPPDPAVSSVVVTDEGGAERPVGEPVADGPTLTVPLTDPLPDGVYTVAWRAVSTEDGHVTAGAFSFGVGEGAAPAGDAAEVAAVGPTALSVGAKALLYAGLMLLVAAAVIGLGAFGGRPASLRWLAVAAGAVAFLGAVGILVAEQRAIDVPMADLMASATGAPFVRLVAVTIAAAGLAVVAVARPRWLPVLWVAAALAALAMFTRTTTGHAAATAAPLVAETMQWLHFLAAGLWVGGLVLLAMVLREAEPAPIDGVRRYSSIAVVAVGVVVITGLARAIGQLGGVGALADALGQRYTQVLLLKVALVAVLIAIGARNRRRSIPRLVDGDPSALRRLVRAEVVVAAGVILATATLTGLSPTPTDAGGGTGGDGGTPGTVVGSDFATTMRVSLTVTPGAPGPNVFRAAVTGYDDGEPVDADAVTLRLRSVTRPEVPPTTVTLAREGDAWVGQSTDLSSSGTWAVTAGVVQGADTTEVPLVVVTASRGENPPGGTTFGTTTFPEGVSMELHLDPGLAGENTLHVDLLAPDGSPLAPGEVIVVGTPEGGAPVRFAPAASEGRVTLAIPLTLEAGAWTIDAVASAPDGRGFQATLVDVPVAAG